MIETVEHPTFTRADFARANKKPGISCITHLMNEEEFAMTALESIAPFFDEMIIVFNDCTDRTPEIVADFAARHPNRVRAFSYVPNVVAIGSRAHRTLSPNSPHSFVYKSNFALSKASYQVRFLWSGDHFAIPDTFAPVVERLRKLKPGTREWWLSPWGIGFWWYSGINLWQANGEFYAPATQPFIGYAHDNPFFPAGRLITYKRYSKGEYLFSRVLLHRYVGCVFYHLKFLKRDRGSAKYRFDENPDSAYKQVHDRRFTNPPLLSLVELRARDPALRTLPDPIALGIRPPGSIPATRNPDPAASV